MSERGVFAVDRGIFDHPLLKGEPFTKVQAMMWLVAEAAWKPRRVRVAGIWLDLKRGQVAHSLRHMADEWQWTVKRVRTFLSSLEGDGTLSTDTSTGITVINICNYDEYQKVSLPKGTFEGTEGAHEGHTKGTITKAFNTGNDSEANASGAVAPISPPPIETSEARLWRIGLTDLMALGLSEARARSMIGSWRRDTGDDCHGVLGAIMRAREYAVTNPIPWITAALKPRKSDEKSKSVHVAAADLVADIRKLNERPGGVCGGEGGAPVRVLSSG